MLLDEKIFGDLIFYFNMYHMNNCYTLFLPKLIILQLIILEWVNLTQMTIISTTVGRNPSEEME